MPEKVDTYSSVSGMRIGRSKVGSTKVFRTWGWTVALIVSEEIKDAMERAGITGTRFKDVTRSDSAGTMDSDRGPDHHSNRNGPPRTE